MYAGRTLLALALLTACDPSAPPADAGTDDASSGSGVVRIRLGVETEGLPDEWEVEGAWVSLGRVRVDSDRGSDLEPVWEAPGRLALEEGGASMTLEAIPATYGGIALTSEPEAGFELTLRRGDARVRAVSERSFEDLMVRCGGGAAALRAGEAVDLRASLSLASLVERVADHVGEATEDVDLEESVVNELEPIFDASWRLECE